MFKRWRLKRKIKKAVNQLVNEAMDAYMDLSVYDGSISTRVLWRNERHYGWGASRSHYDDLEETTITISTKTLYKRSAPPPRKPSCLSVPCPPVPPKPKGPARASDNAAPDVVPPKKNDHDKDITDNGNK